MPERKIKTCYNCKEKFRAEELISYASPRAKIYHNYCPKCLIEKQSKDNFSDKVCSIFGIKAPGPRIWTERKRLQETYGYTDNSIIDCLDYIYNVEKKKKFSETLFLVNPATMNKMKMYKREKEKESLKLAAAITTKTNEYVAPVQVEKKKSKIEYDPDEWLD